MTRIELTETDKEILKLWDNADEDGKNFIFDMLICTVAGGDDFLKEMQTYLEAGDKDAMRACVANWKTAIEEGIGSLKPEAFTQREPKETESLIDTLKNKPQQANALRSYASQNAPQRAFYAR